MNQHNILRLDIPVQNVLLMNVTNRIQQVTHNERSTLLRKFLPIFYDIIKLTALAHLQDGVKVIFVVKETINASDVWMV